MKAGLASSADAHTIVVDDTQNALVVLPDMLLSPTRVSGSFDCLRKAVLDDTLRGSTSRQALLGQLKHALFEAALSRANFSEDYLARVAAVLVQRPQTMQV